VGLLATLALIAQPAVADVRDMAPDSILSWGVEESLGDTSSSAAISVPDGKDFWKLAAFCQEFGKGKVARYPEGASCDPASYKSKSLVQFSLLAPVCSDGGKNCLESIFAVGPDGKKIKGKFLGYVDPKSAVPANRSIGNPRGISSGVWQLPGVLNSAGTDLYEVHLNMEGGLVEFNRGRQLDKFSLKNRTFNAGIRPVRAELTAAGVKKDFDCQDCNALPANYEFGLTAILPESVHTWYSGRLQNADVAYKRVDSTYQRITVTGTPAEVPTFRGKIKRAEASRNLLKQFHWCEADWPDCYGGYTNGYGNEGNWTDFLEAWRPHVKDSATGSATVWTVRSVPVFFGGAYTGNFYACAPKNKVAGIVSTNALMYNGNVPQYSQGEDRREVFTFNFDLAVWRKEISQHLINNIFPWLCYR
jgi:hypothetical protein